MWLEVRGKIKMFNSYLIFQNSKLVFFLTKVKDKILFKKQGGDFKHFVQFEAISIKCSQLAKDKKYKESLETMITASEIDANCMMSKTVKKTATNKSDQSPGTPGGIELQKKRKSKRKRKGKLPKNYNAEVAPDPERWLPKYERTGFRRKRDRRAKDVIKGSQGMASGAADQL